MNPEIFANVQIPCRSHYNLGNRVSISGCNHICYSTMHTTRKLTDMNLQKGMHQVYVKNYISEAA